MIVLEVYHHIYGLDNDMEVTFGVFSKMATMVTTLAPPRNLELRSSRAWDMRVPRDADRFHDPKCF